MSRLRIKNKIKKKNRQVTTKTRGFTDEDSDPQSVKCGARSRKEALDEIKNTTRTKDHCLNCLFNDPILNWSVPLELKPLFTKSDFD